MKKNATMTTLCGWPLLALASQFLPCRAHAQAIVATYNERPPYMVTAADGTPTGLTGSPAVQAFAAAGIPVSYQKTPSNRQLMMIKQAAVRNCALGWFRTPERERYAKFSKAIYRDKAWMVLAYAGFNVPDGATLESLLRDANTRVLVKENFSYGPQIDDLLARYQPARAMSAGSPLQMMHSVSMGTVDLMFVAEEEGNYMLSHAGTHAKDLRLLHFPDLPKGAERYIMCSKNVPDEVIVKLNKAITFK